MDSIEQRLITLETRAAHQDKVIADLNDVITAQWKKIDALERQLRRLDDELQAMDTEAPPIQKPPHY